MTPVPRISGRVILLDDDESVLLLGFPDPERVSRFMWITPGGRTESGEEERAAAARELREETGLTVAPDELGEPVASFEAVWDAPAGAPRPARRSSMIMALLRRP